ncbi:hypothetical protein A5630_17925 [Mycolicibacterium mucogenicum]|uniref:Tox-REase-7 domain-containing protein n=1 Tax=Mycolicibacterium mucogenicum TaxID=56689 RepID=A0A1A3H851_MYCMU|nr:putative toxin [Mycolicibacterium mucogenicum]OBJ43844.1 hypothetical protein A5630_17925 [Mycolicibacterium mucogenicum]
MTKITPENYYAVAAKLCAASAQLATDVKNLDNALDVSQSAGTYASGGPTWAQSFDQSASDVFELGSTTAIAARELGYLVHQAGLNHAHAENESGGGGNQPTPPAPQGCTLETNLHPSQHAVGGTHEKPDKWDLIAEYVTKQWADCDEGRIDSAGKQFTSFANSKGATAVQLWNDVTMVFTNDAQHQSPEVNGIVDEVAAVCRSLRDTGDAASALGTACSEVHRVATIDKSTGRTSLKILDLIIKSYEIDKIAARRLPFGSWMVRQLDELIKTNKIAYARGMDKLIEGINGTVDTAAKSNQGIYSLATGSTQGLSSILNRTPRQTNPIRNRDDRDNDAAGKRGEQRAGVPGNYKKRWVRVTVNGVPRIVEPDYIDRANKNVVEVKNTNEIRGNYDQIAAETEWARQQGFTMTLVVDHRTVINDPRIQAMIDSGQIQLIRKELDDNDDI